MKFVILSILFLILSPGCNQDLNNSSENNKATGKYIEVEPEITDLGIVNKVGAEGQFLLKVISDKPVKIVDVDYPCCGKITFSPDLTGMILQPGEEITAFMKVNQLKFGKYTARARITTEPAEAQPILLTMNMVFAGIPKVGPKELVIRQTYGQPQEGVITVQFLRTSEDPPLTIDQETSSFGKLSLVDISSESAKFSRHPNELLTPTQDTITLKVRSPGQLPYGLYKEIIKLNFGKNHKSAEIPIRVFTGHPLQPKLTRLFLGVLDPGDKIKKQVTFGNNDLLSDATVSIDQLTDFKVSVDVVEGAVNLEGSAPTTPGRFTATLSVQLANTNEDLKIPVSGIVRLNN